MITSLANQSYSAYSVYKTVPQFIKDKDAENGYVLWNYIYGVAKSIDTLNVLSRDNMGPGVHIEVNFGVNTGKQIIDAKLANPINPTDTTITIFDTDSSWYLIDTSSPFQFLLVDTLNNDEELITVPAGNYNWNAPFVVFKNVTRGTNATYHAASAGADGSVYIKDYAGAPGWSQTIDINRCPDYALPWLAQFVGAEILPGSQLTRQEAVQKIKSRAGFNRATSSAIVEEIVAITNKQLPGSITPLSSSQVIVLENSQASTTGGVTTYVYNQYALTLLIPSRVFSSYTYQSLQNASGGSYATYTSTQSFITGLGGLYFDLAGSTTPSSSSPYVNFVYRYRPAGMQIFIGGY
jgi:hypothetical protein